jgi:uncharacterized protein (TIGR02270 family)
VSRVIPEIVAQHAEEAAFLWLLRDAAVRAPHYLLDDLVLLDQRVEAHLDGLRLAGAEGWAASQDELKFQQPGEVFAAAMLAIESGDRRRLDPLVALAAGEPELRRALVSAFGWMPSPHASNLMRELLAAAEPAARLIAVAAHAIRREEPAPGWGRSLGDGDAFVRARALRAAAEFGKVDLLREVRLAVTDKDPACSFWAAWAAARLGDRSAAVVQALQQIAAQPGPFQERAVGVYVRIAPRHAAAQWLDKFWQNPATMRAAAVGIGALGDPRLVRVLLELMRIDETARAAGEAFSTITGVHLAYDKLEREAPEDFQAGPTEDPADENVAMDPDEDLACPDAALVANWWSANKQRFDDGRRYLCGGEISEPSLPAVLREGYQRQRTAAAMELGLLEPARPLFEVRARGDWQRQLLPAWFPEAR